MFFIPGQLISVVTFPGVIIHEFAHQWFCKLTGTAVLDVCYFRMGNPAGYVVHEKPKKLSSHLLIGIGPFVVNTILGILITFPSSIPVIKFGTGDALDYILMWLGMSILMHAFPSSGDAKSLMTAVNETKDKTIIKTICYPIILLIYIGAFGSVVWLDLAYGYVVAAFFPELIIKLFS